VPSGPKWTPPPSISIKESNSFYTHIVSFQFALGTMQHSLEQVFWTLSPCVNRPECESNDSLSSNEQVGLEATFTPEVLGWNLGQECGYLDRDYSWFSSVTLGKCWDCTLIRPKTLPSIGLQIHFSPGYPQSDII
jgi:hypothetical protein